MKTNKACPVILKMERGQPYILAFAHPLAGNQLVKGSIEPNESIEQACMRELKEESGITAHPKRNLGTWHTDYQDQVWGFYLMEPEEALPMSWSFYTKDDGGHIFQFFWQPLYDIPDSKWHPLFVGAIKYLKQALALKDLPRTK